jgi:cyanophycinase-like exopeptidase
MNSSAFPGCGASAGIAIMSIHIIAPCFGIV